MHLAVALDGAGWHAAAWREPGAGATGLFGAAHWAEQVREVERGRLDFVTFEDSHRLQSTLADGPDRRTDRVRGRLDAIMVAGRVAPDTRHVGIVPAASTTLTEPFLLSTQIATLDCITGGRGGWLLQVPDAAGDAGYAGPRPVPAVPERFEEAAEHASVVRELWDSWEDGAEIRDAATNRFFDRRRVHHIDHVGARFSVKGPSITPRSPQGQPVIAMAAGRGGPHDALAAANADVILVATADECELASAPERLGHGVAVAGREPAEVRTLADVVVFLDSSRSAAIARKLRLDELAAEHHRPRHHVFVGTPPDLANQLVGWVELGYDGFRLWPGAIPHDLHGITRALVPELVTRGAFRRRYEAQTLRGLLGLERPPSRYRAVALQAR